MGAFNYNIIISNIFLFNFCHIPAKMHLKVNNSEDNFFFNGPLICKYQGKQPFYQMAVLYNQKH